MVYPWGTSVPLLPDEERGKVSDYGNFYDLLATNSGATFGLISMNANLCVCSCAMLVEAEYVLNRELVSARLRTCIKDNEPFIIMDITLASIDRREPIIVLHSNMAIVDRTRKVIERYEPRHLTEAHYLKKFQQSIDSALIDLLREALGEEYSYCPPLTFCVGGPQTERPGPYCFLWSLLYVHLRLINPRLSKKRISRSLTEAAQKTDILVDYIEVLKNTRDALLSDSTIYSRAQRRHFDVLSKLFSHTDFIRSVMLTLRYKKGYAALLSYLEDRMADPFIFKWWYWFSGRAQLEDEEGKHRWSIEDGALYDEER